VVTLNSGLRAAGHGPRSCEALTLGRAEADEVLERERAAEDVSLQRERKEQARMLLELLPLEREKTDQ
jgi:hypothetical protein